MRTTGKGAAMDDRRRRSDDVLMALARDRGPALHAYASLLTGNLRDAEDLVQDALVKTFVRGRHVELASAEGYVRTAILTTWIDSYRRRRQWERVRHLLVRDERQESRADEVEARADVRTCGPRSAVCLRSSGRAWCCGTTTTSPWARSPIGWASPTAPSSAT